jgi:hypothetical protein
MVGYKGAERPLFSLPLIMISYFSQVFNAQLDVDDIENRPLNEIYIILDELTSYKEVYAKMFNKISKKELDQHQDLIEDMKAYNSLFIIAKRRAHFLNHAKVNQLTKAIMIWKKRAFLLGKQLNMTNDEVKKVMVYPTGG